ncbi:LOW QUALITY PROTEIN: chondroitin sulfate proteoglycan 4-like [Diretmus argenteus]
MDDWNSAIILFSLPDLEEGKSSFVHTGVNTSRLALRVSDGQTLSNTVILRIMAVALEYKLANYTGLEVDQGGTSLITTDQLAVKVNVDDQAVEIHYDVTEAPRYGELQRLHPDGEWKSTNHFPQKLLEEERIRYLSIYRGLQAQDNITDHFRCKISIGPTATEEVVFPITVRWIHFEVTRSKMEVNGVRKTVMTSEDLYAIAKGVKLPETDISFRLLMLPKKGHLYLNHKALKTNSTFSQKNITDNLVKYELLNRPHEDARDVFSFQVLSEHANSSSHDFRIIIKAESTAVTVVNEGLSVLEGESKVLTKDVLFTGTVSNKVVRYTVTASPRHGQIRKINLSNSTSINDNITTFTNQDIIEERIMYVHDNSESKEDSFTFHIAVYKPHKQHAGRKEGRNTGGQHTFNISVQLVNDQRPARVIDKVFHVARDGQRLLTSDDLRYHDDDSDFEDGRLVYTRRGIPMGELVLASDTGHKLYEFTQQDLEQKKVLFVHRGVSFGRFVLFVSDGKHYVSSLLEVLAQDPYLQVENNTGLMVQRGGVTTLTSSILSVHTNLDVRDPKEVTYEVFLPPKHGVLFLDDGDGGNTVATDGISFFTQQDLVVGRLAYRHDNSHNLLDGFNVTARVRERSSEQRVDRGRREVQLDIGVAVKVFLESHQRPPTVLTNRPVVVEEGQKVSISREHLEVVHEDSQPSEIVFSVQSPPALGFLQRTSSGEQHGDHQGDHQHRYRYQGIRDQSITSFTQEDVSLGLVLYQNQEARSTNDSLLLDATNGVTEVGPIRLEIDVIPILLPLQVSDLTLDEGSSLPLTPIKVANHHFSGMNFLYQVLVPHGHLEHSRIPGMPITAFTHTEVEREYISYIHDGSDTLCDNFTIMANQTEIRKHSLPCVVHINITPVDDETPVITANRELKIWVGCEISVDDLNAEDPDTEPEGLEFVVTPPSNGHLALKSSPSRHLLNFTQNHIHTGQLVFIHSGALSGGFHFQVNDGVNFAPRQIFSIAASSLVLTLLRNQPLEVYPGSVTPISERELQVVTNGDGRRNHSVMFAVTTAPKLGNLVRRLPDNSTRPVSAFTQRMVTDGLIWYDQNQPEAVGWSATDYFSFTVSSPPAFLPPHTFIISISYQANSRYRYQPQRKTKLLANTGVVVAEGGRVIIDRPMLDASNLLGKLPEDQRRDHQVLYRVISLPHHGALSIGGHNLTRNQLDFSQGTLNKLGIRYVHDDSETTSDGFTLQAWVAPLDPSSSSSRSTHSAFSSASSSSSRLSGVRAQLHRVEDRLVVTERFNITVTPANDQPQLGRNRSPSLTVVVGESVVLGPENLQVESRHTPPEELHYSVISKPNNGYLTLGERLEPVTSFTQYDINHGQYGEPSTGVFYFNVTDGYHSPLYKLFILEVTKAAVSMVNNTGLSLLQGRTAVVLTTNQLAAQTNGRHHAIITYMVTMHPHHGRIVIDDHQVINFHHEDLQFGHVVYHMTDLSASEDSFQISVTASAPGMVYANLTGQMVNVTVRPMIYLREPVRVPSGIAVKLGKAMMDASELARISRADPVFEVLSPPKHGKLVKMTSDPDQASEVLRSFTFRDVVQGRVAIEETLSENSAVTTARGHAPATSLNDSFIFLLKAGHVQPAKGELHFTILPHHHMHQGPGGSDGPGREHTTARQNRTTTGGRGGGRGGSTTQAGVSGGGSSSHPHILSHKNQNRITRGGREGGRPGGGTDGGGGGQKHARHPHHIPSAPGKHSPASPPVHVEVLPRPASDPLLIILPFLACLLLIVVLVVVILVIRHRREKRARIRLFRELAGLSPPGEGSPYLGRPERSVAMPSVIVTPIGSSSCPSSPAVHLSPRRRRSLSPGVRFWGPTKAVGGGEESNGGMNVIPAVTLRDDQYWVLPRPASDPLLIILPFLACLLLIVVLVVVILVIRHRREKRARIRLFRELAGLSPPGEGSPYLGRPERSVAMPSVIVTPIGSSSCPSSPAVHLSPRRRRSLSPGVRFWGPTKAVGGGEESNGGMNVIPAVTLRDDQYWVLPRPASDPLLIILPFLACLLLIVVLVVVILVIRHRREKRARIRLFRELAGLSPPGEGSPYLGRPERSVAMPSVIVTPIGSSSCPSSPAVHLSPRRRRSLSPGVRFWGPTKAVGGGEESNGGMNVIPAVTLRDDQYWVLPRPASDPLLIILPFLACLLLIVVLVVVILVIRHRREKRARIRLFRELAGLSPPGEGSPYLGRPERSVAMPSVIVTPIGSSSCPSSPAVHLSPRRRRSLSPGVRFWGPTKAVGGGEESNGGMNVIPAVTLRDDQYWIFRSRAARWRNVQSSRLPVHVEVLPRPASDPLLIILPFLACLLLIVVLVVVILVIRHRREKRARIRLFRELAGLSPPGEGSPYLGRPERSVAMPSVIVTPIGSSSCPSSPAVHLSPRRRRSLSPGVRFWGPTKAVGGGEESNGGMNVIPAVTLRDDQYWIFRSRAARWRNVQSSRLPVHVEVLPRPASDPLLIILPFLACLLLIVVLVVVILVIRHRREKRARIRLFRELAGLSPPGEGSPYLGRPERSVAMPSVIVTPIGSSSCPSSPAVHLSPRRRRSLSPGVRFWGPTKAVGGGEESNGGMNVIPAVTLRDDQYWV